MTDQTFKHSGTPGQLLYLNFDNICTTKSYRNTQLPIDQTSPKKFPLPPPHSQLSAAKNRKNFFLPSDLIALLMNIKSFTVI